jgi:hypothetical protein
MSGGTVSVLYSFSGKQSDGRFPIGGLIEATDGNLYGTTDEGGLANRLGAIPLPVFCSILAVSFTDFASMAVPTVRAPYIASTWASIHS